MPTVRVELLFRAPQADVFATVSDHRRLLSGPAIQTCHLTPAPGENPNGVGAVRDVRGLGLHFVEDITLFDPPRAYEYRVRHVNLPATHEFGRLDFQPCAEGTQVIWQTRYTAAGPAGPLLNAVTAPALKLMFTHLLRRLRHGMNA